MFIRSFPACIAQTAHRKLFFFLPFLFPRLFTARKTIAAAASTMIEPSAMITGSTPEPVGSSGTGVAASAGVGESVGFGVAIGFGVGVGVGVGAAVGPGVGVA